MWPTVGVTSLELVGRWEHHEIERFAQLHTNRVELYKSYDFVVSSSAHEFPRFHTDGRPHLVDHVACFPEETSPDWSPASMWWMRAPGSVARATSAARPPTTTRPSAAA